MSIDTILLLVLLISGLYMAWNIGANDVANAMGTSVGSGALTLRQAVLIAAVLEFCGAFFFGSHVTETLEQGIIKAEILSNHPRFLVYGMLASLVGAGVWLQIASYYGWPVSTTHSIVGALVGFGIIVGGLDAIYWGNIAFIASSWILSPVCGGLMAYAIFSLLRNKIFFSKNPLEKAKKLAPLLLFAVIFVLTLGFVIDGLRNYAFQWWQSVLISLLVACVSAFIGRQYFRRFHPTVQAVRAHTSYQPGAIEALNKAGKYLQNAHAASSGELRYQVGNLVEEIDSLSHDLRKEVEVRVEHSEYELVEKIFARLQLMSACLMAFAHGANDVANAIGPLAAGVSVLTTGVIIANGVVPSWALALGGFGIVLGLATWGWRVIETIGKRLTELTPTRGFAAEFSAAATVLVASRLGMPISTTHTLVGAVLGVGFARGIEALNLALTRDIIISWFITIPLGAGLSVGFFYAAKFLFG